MQYLRNTNEIFIFYLHIFIIKLIYENVHVINISVADDSVIILTTLTTHECLHQSLYIEQRNFLVKAESSTKFLYKRIYNTF